MKTKVLVAGNGKCACAELIKAIDRYIEKADNDLEEQLSDAGFVDTEDSISGMEALEDSLAGILEDQTAEIVKKLKNVTSWETAKSIIEEFFANDSETAEALKDVFEEYFNASVLGFADTYIKESAGDMAVTVLRNRTTSWFSTWSSELADLMQLSSQSKMGSLVEHAIKNGDGVADLTRAIMEEGIRNEEWQARRAALTEMLRAHSVARDEAITQNPVVDRRKWRHTGAYKNTPRKNHQEMDGQIVKKNEPYVLEGADGNTYYPKFPRDPSLPAGEAINCHCTEEAIVNDEVLGLSLEEREALQQQIIDDDDGAWEIELDEANRAKAGIDID